MKNKKISKPWAVYMGYFGPIGIGKITKDSKGSCYIQYNKDNPDTVHWNQEWVKKFKTPKSAIDYFWNNSSQYSKKELKEIFLSNFPKERKILEKILAQTLPKCTDYNCDSLGDEIGRASHSYR